MDVGTMQFGQSHAINRYVAKKHGWMGKNDEEAAVIDALYEHVRDIKDAFSKVVLPLADCALETFQVFHGLSLPKKRRGEGGDAWA